MKKDNIFNREEFNKKYIKSLNTQGRRKIWNYFLDLIKTDKFQQDINQIKEQLNNGENPNYNLYKDISQKIRLLAISYGLDSDGWEESLNEYIFHNKLEVPEGIDMCRVMAVSDLEEALLTPDEEKEDAYMMTLLPENYKEEYLRNRKEILRHKHPLEDYNTKINILDNYPIVILVNPKASLRDIQDFIAKNYDLSIANLQKAFKDNIPSANNLGKIKRKNNFIQERNDFIYQNRNLARREIMKLVTDKFGPKNNIDYGYIGKIISLENKKRKKM